jgi:hypothetical protein
LQGRRFGGAPLRDDVSELRFEKTLATRSAA